MQLTSLLTRVSIVVDVSVHADMHGSAILIAVVRDLQRTTMFLTMDAEVALLGVYVDVDVHIASERELIAFL